MEIVSNPVPALAIDVGDASLKRDPQATRAPGVPAPNVAMTATLPSDTVARTVISALATIASQQDSLAPFLADLTKAMPFASLPAPVRAEIARVVVLAEQVGQSQPASDEGAPAPPAGASVQGSASPAASQRAALPALAEAIERLQASLRQWQPEASSRPQSPSGPIAPSTPAAPSSAPPPLVNQEPASIIQSLSVAAGAAVPPPALPFQPQMARNGGLADALASLLVAQQPPVTAQEAQRRQRGSGNGPAAGASADGDALLASNALSAYRKAMPTAAKAQPQPTSWPAEPSPAFIAKTLLQRAEAALSQTRALEVVSQGLRAEQSQPAGAAPTHWAFDAPLATPFGRALVRFEIDRQTPRADRGKQEPVWRVRLALDLEPLGAVHAQIALQGSKAWVRLWAEKPETALLLDEHKRELRQTFLADEMEAEIVLNSFMPAAPDLEQGALWDANI
jgi:hypothetical protein